MVAGTTCTVEAHYTSVPLSSMQGLIEVAEWASLERTWELSRLRRMSINYRVQYAAVETVRLWGKACPGMWSDFPSSPKALSARCINIVVEVYDERGGTIQRLAFPC